MPGQLRGFSPCWDRGFAQCHGEGAALPAHWKGWGGFLGGAGSDGVTGTLAQAVLRGYK